MGMTHYMELLATNQPWNLIIFMAIPVVLAETIAVTELYILYTRDYRGPVRMLNRVCSIVIGRSRDEHGRMALHAGFVALFLVVGHIAMVFGMLDPAVMGGPAAHRH
jgi:hypothetical protein